MIQNNIKQILIFILSTILYNTNAISQHFKSLNKDVVSYFKNSETIDIFSINGSKPNIIRITIDTVFFDSNENTIYRLNKLINEENGAFVTCYKKTSPGILGGQFIVTSNNKILLFNNLNDTIVINTKKDTASWLCYKSDSFNIIINARINRISDTIIFDEPDIVSYIELTVSDKKGKLLNNHFLQKFNIVLSNKWGLLKTPYIITFPNKFSINDSVLNLIGLLKKDGSFKKGVTDFYRDHAFEYEIGDEIHEERGGSCGNCWNEPYSSGYDNTQIIKKVINKSIFTDSIIYEISERKWIYIKRRRLDLNIDSVFTDKVIFDTIKQTVNYSRSKFSYNVNDFTDGGDYKYDLFYANGLVSMNECVNQKFARLNDTCYQKKFEPNCYVPYIYYKSIGGGYSQYTSNGNSGWNKLLYYKKGNKEWGSPLSQNVLVKEISLKGANIFIYPNPAKETVQIETTENGNYELLNLSGQILNIGVLKVNQVNQISLDTIANGLYLIRFYGTNSAKNYKIIKGDQ